MIFMWVVVGVGVSMGSQTGYAMNPARDLGPRMMAYIFGYGPSVWTEGNYYWFWTPCSSFALTQSDYLSIHGTDIARYVVNGF